MIHTILKLFSFFGIVHSFTTLSPTYKLKTAIYEKKGDGDGGILGAIGNLFQELDAFVDDATSRRLGAGSAFYGKRKSSFYGNDDKMKKRNRRKFDPTEDYRGPNQAGYFQWMKDEQTGEMKPVTRMKKKNIERNPKSWRMLNKEDE
mmetsp:Transcript_33414/g.38029  ORF Transcript_33414/g.38029 Transcript_33414/m.38029 type:complete len:147 (+) Transcript_33414:60-500(+)|eukprot:CAMPEP_0194130112 /NCGR_PEP_ID=MMETSP0152-20130528/1243_1 /TAXON_ID=1049557 /ORGANISM="Thalassiothrix antarctica, Strain L6-D1" /LENGTH=146 /DNA_ID=CAMNT_0038824533 /DNA_START=59 /DNA_END=499 /DNA_ORIENTATION=-